MIRSQKLTILIVLLLLIGSLVNTAQATSLQPYYMSEPNWPRREPDPCDPLTDWTPAPADPCDPNNKSVVGPVPPGSFFWIAFKNLGLPIEKHLTLKLIPDPCQVQNIGLYDSRGYDDANATGGRRPSSVGLHFDNASPRYRGWRFRWRRQPRWEMFKFKNSSKQPKTFKVYAASSCLQQETAEPNFLGVENASFGAPGAMIEDETPFTEIWYFPLFIDVDTSVAPSFSGPPGSGPWKSSFTSIDPFGEDQPHGGVKFATEGYGLNAGEQFSMQFAMTEEADDLYWVYTLDAAGDLDSYFLDLSPMPCDGEIIDGDINEDCIVDWFDFAIFADHWLEKQGAEP